MKTTLFLGFGVLFCGGQVVQQSDSLWIEAIGQSAGPGADGTVSPTRGQSLEEMVRWVDLVL